jgi:hypothetical protein
VDIKHDAFISYNHSADNALAKALEASMEKLAKPLLSLRAFDVFRDETGLAANPDLWAGILHHLNGAKWLVVLACPEWAESHWCRREVLWWLENRVAAHILIVLVGAIRWRARGAIFNDPADGPAVLDDAPVPQPRMRSGRNHPSARTRIVIVLFENRRWDCFFMLCHSLGGAFIG